VQPYARIAGLMATFRPTWFVCGGWAVDAWLGRQTRDHGDVDIVVFHDDQRALFEHFSGWHLIAHTAFEATPSTDQWDGRPLRASDHIHARPGGEANRALLEAWVTSPGTQPADDLNLELVLNERVGDDWLMSREPRVSLPVGRAVGPCPAGPPAAVPEVLMFYKATAYPGVEGYPREKDRDDFLALAPLLDSVRLDWLRGAIGAMEPAHPWLSLLGPPS
jgi:hypothetical protein